jgi:hypothetical protein
MLIEPQPPVNLFILHLFLPGIELFPLRRFSFDSHFVAGPMSTRKKKFGKKWKISFPPGGATRPLPVGK